MELRAERLVRTGRHGHGRCLARDGDNRQLIVVGLREDLVMIRRVSC
jgi:hypothetical protein